MSDPDLTPAMENPPSQEVPAEALAKPEPKDSPGQVAYEAFYAATGNTASWAACPRKDAWEKAAQAVLSCSPK